MSEYKDPEDLRAIPLDRLEEEGSKLGLQFREWNDLFNIDSAVRRHKLSELYKWCIFSNRYLLMEREHLTDYKLFTKDEVLGMLKDAYIRGWQERRFSAEEDKNQWESEREFIETMLKKLS